MGAIYLRKYGVATTINFCLYELDGTDLQAGAAHAAGDTKIMKDEGAEANTGSAFVDEGQGYSLALSAAEMTAARVAIYVVDQTNPKAWLDRVLIVETYGHASGQHVFDLGTATVNLSAASEAQIDAIETDTNEIQGKLPTNKFMGSSVVTDKDDEIDAIKAKTDLIPADITAQLDTNVPAILADTNELQTDWANGGRLDLLLDSIVTKVDTVDDYVDTEVAAIKAVTDTLSLVAIADAVHDETTETGITLRKAINIILAALAGKSSGGGTTTIKFRDQADGKDRVTATVDSDGNRTAITNDGA
jgi:hypothetical protein